MDKEKLFYTAEREAWRQWLAAHFETETEVWFVFPSKASGEPGLSYNDAVEEALCFGWIDSTARRLDALHSVRHFTPRRAGSPYSQANIERLKWLDAQGLIHPKIRPSVEALLNKEFLFPADILDAIRQDEAAWESFASFSESYKRIRVAYIDAARERPEEFQKRLDHFIRKTRQNKRITGYGGIDKYYR